MRIAKHVILISVLVIYTGSIFVLDMNPTAMTPTNSSLYKQRVNVVALAIFCSIRYFLHVERRNIWSNAIYPFLLSIFFVNAIVREIFRSKSFENTPHEKTNIVRWDKFVEFFGITVVYFVAYTTAVPRTLFRMLVFTLLWLFTLPIIYTVKHFIRGVNVNKTAACADGKIYSDIAGKCVGSGDHCKTISDRIYKYDSNGACQATALCENGKVFYKDSCTSVGTECGFNEWNKKLRRVDAQGRCMSSSEECVSGYVFSKQSAGPYNTHRCEIVGEECGEDASTGLVRKFDGSGNCVVTGMCRVGRVVAKEGPLKGNCVLPGQD